MKSQGVAERLNMSPDVPPEAEVIRLAREAMDMTAQSAAEASRAHDGKGVSAAYWRDVERGYGGRRGQRVTTRASARALAAMARVVGIVPPQLAAADREDAARVLEEILRREQAPAVIPESPRETPDPDDDVTGAVVAALFGLKERAIWAQVRRRLAATPAGTALFADPGQAAAWPPESGPFDLTPQTRQVLTATPADMLFDAQAEIVVWNIDKLPFRKRVEMIREYREPIRSAGIARRAGLKEPPYGLTALRSQHNQTCRNGARSACDARGIISRKVADRKGWVRRV